MDLDYEKRVQNLCLWGISQGWVKSAHDISEGGLAISLAEACLSPSEGGIGARIDNPGGPDEVSSLFGESQSRIIVTVTGDGYQRLKARGDKLGVKVRRIGQVGGKSLRIANLIDLDLARLEDEYRWTLIKIMEGQT